MSPDLLTDVTAGATVLRGPGLAELPVVRFVDPSTLERSAADGDQVTPLQIGIPPRRDDTTSQPEPDSPTGAELDAAYQRGWDEGRAAMTGAAEGTERAREALTEAMAQLRSTIENQRSTTDELAVDLAVEIARLILAREVATATDPGREALVRCLAELDVAAPATIRLNPADLAALGGVDDLTAGRLVDLVADPAVESGDAIADLSGGRVDASIADALQRVTKALRS